MSILLVATVAASPVQARAPLAEDWIAAYPGSTSDDAVVAGTGAVCQLCHQESNGGDGWNAYGWAIRVRTQLGDTAEQAFAAVEAADSDGDPGGATNVAEIGAGAQPGWTVGPVNVVYFKAGTTLPGQSPPAVAGALDPSAGTTTSTSTTTTSSSSTSLTTTSTTTTSTTSSTTSTSLTTTTSMPGATSTTSTSTTTSSTTSSTTTSTTSSTSTSTSSTTSSSSSTTTTSTSSTTSTSTSTTTFSTTTSTTSTTLPGTVTAFLDAERDTTTYAESGDLSNGAGQHLFAGATAAGDARRALVAFDVQSVVPPGSVVTGVTLTLHLSRTRGPETAVAVHRVLADWGEGTSDAPAEEGTGAAATAGDATWTHRLYDVEPWAMAGGDVSAAPSAATPVGPEGVSHAWLGAGLVADVQAWVDAEEPNYGWMLIGDEGGDLTAKRFDSRTHPVPAARPRLAVQFVPSGSTTTVPTSTSTTTSTTPPLVLEPFVDPLPLPAVAQPETGAPGGSASYRLAIREVTQQLHRDLPPSRVWGFGDGPAGATYPGPTIEAARDVPIAVTWVNDLRDESGALRTEHLLEVDTCLHGADDESPRAVVHLHGGHVPAEFDGYPETTLLPGEETTYVYPNAQPAATLWYHDHALGITRLNVYLGLAGFYLVRDAEEAALGLPSGSFEVPLAIQDRSFAPDGSLVYPAVWHEHFFGDVVLVNGKVWPYLEVTPGKYRLRILSGSTSRTYRLSLSNGQSFQVIASEGGLLPAPVTRTEITLASGERADVVVDFAGHPPGTAIRLLNDAPAPFPGQSGVGVVANVLEFRVVDGPAHTAPLPATLVPVTPLAEEGATVHRDLALRKTSDPCTGQVWLIDGLGWDDVTERPELGETEVWRFVNRSGVMHPMHMHLVLFQVLDRQAFEVVDDVVVPVGPRVPPPPEEAGWKDTVRVGPNEMVRIIARFDDYKGRFPYHCHILEHEDHEMMRQFEVVACGDGELDAGEGCDDGNRDAGDGCSAACEIELVSTTTTTTTTTMTPTSSSTTTTTSTVPEDVRPLAGARLELVDRPGKPNRRRLRIVSTDGDALVPGSSEVETILATGATLRVAATGGDGFTLTHPLPAAGWTTLGRAGSERGVRYRGGAGPIRKVVLRAGRRLVVAGRGAELGTSLTTEPDAVRIELAAGLVRWCLEFGGERRRFVPGRRLFRADATAPARCP